MMGQRLVCRCLLNGILALLILVVAGCASTSQHSGTSPTTDIEIMSGCERAQDQEQCKLQHKTNGSDVPTVDNAVQTRP